MEFNMLYYLLANIIYQIKLGKRFTGKQIRFIPLFNEDLQNAFRYTRFMLRPACDWLNSNENAILNCLYEIKFNEFNENNEIKMHELQTMFSKFMPHLKCIDSRDAKYFWNHIIQNIYEYSIHNKYKPIM